MNSIFSGLPNDIIMKIIRETKSSVDYKQDHKEIFNNVIVEELEDEVMEFWINYNWLVGRPGYEDREEWVWMRRSKVMSTSMIS
jgi:type II restriction/modification system DNA methylase subunit YeeA